MGPLDELLEEALDDEPLGVRVVEPVGAQVVELLRVDLGDRGGVRAADVVGLDLEPGDRVGVGIRGEQQVAALLEGVGALGARVDADHPAPDGGRPLGEHAAEGEVGGRVLGRVLLGRVVVEVLGAVAGVGAGHLRARAAPGELGLHPHLAARRAEAERDPLEVRVAADLGPLGREDPAFVGELLLADVAEVGAVADDELDDAVEERPRPSDA